MLSGLISLPFGGSIGALALTTAGVAYLGGMAVSALRLPAFGVAVAASVVCAIITNSWPDRIAAIAIGVAAVAGWRHRYRSQGD